MIGKRIRVGLAALFIWGCAGDDVPFDDGAIDDEYGMIEWERADENAVVRPGSAEADAVLAYVNQPLTNAGDVTRFEVELDTELDRRAAESITAARTGPDGVIGTADDGFLETLPALDAVPWVGRAVMQQLLRLAMRAGFFTPSSPCEEVFGLPLGRAVDVRTLAQLIEIENSQCDHFGGDLIVDIRQTLLPAHRSLKAFDHVREVRGELRIGWNTELDEVVFRSLQSVGTIDTAKFKVSGTTNVEFPALTHVHKLVSNEGQSRYLFDNLERADNIQLTNHPGTFPALREVRSLIVRNPIVQGFDALESAHSIILYPTQQVLGFAALETTDGIYIEAPELQLTVQAFQALRESQTFEIAFESTFRQLTFSGLPALETTDYLAFPGSAAEFDSLTTAGVVNTTISHEFTGSFDALTTADEVTSRAPHYPFPALVEVTGSFRLEGDSATSSLSVLESVGEDFTAQTGHSTYDALNSVGRAVRVAHKSGSWDGLNALQSVGGAFFFDCYEGDADGFSALRSLSRSASLSTYDCAMSGFDALVEVDANLSVNIHDPRGTFDALENLEASGHLQIIDRGEQPQDLLPALTIVNGDFNAQRAPRTIAPNATRLRGLNALGTINGNFRLQSATGIDGLGSLTAIGGQLLLLPADMPEAERDAFLDQLLQFSGEIRTQ